MQKSETTKCLKSLEESFTKKLRERTKKNGKVLTEKVKEFWAGVF